ncbi:hypothetical protein [Roseateles sp.]|uniref:hypothetical protein n=1 Tax=Roseateles sp. TaxID=1971397 RepID=UPI003265ADB9
MLFGQQHAGDAGERGAGHLHHAHQERLSRAALAVDDEGGRRRLGIGGGLFDERHDVAHLAVSPAGELAHHVIAHAMGVEGFDEVAFAFHVRPQWL